MRTKSIFTNASIWSSSGGCSDYQNDTSGFLQSISGPRGSALRPGDSWMDQLISQARLPISNQQSSASRGQHSSGPGSSDGCYVRTIGGRNTDGSPRFDQAVDPGNYLWWYIDGLSDDGLYGFSIIAFVGSVFSPYYAWANRSMPAQAEDFCAINVALYTPNKKYWTMTERSKNAIYRIADQFTIGPSQLSWKNNVLTITINERVPLVGQKFRELSKSMRSNFLIM